MSLYAVPGFLFRPIDDTAEAPSKDLYHLNDSDSYHQFAQAMYKRRNNHHTNDKNDRYCRMDDSKVVVDYSLVQSLNNNHPKDTKHAESSSSRRASYYQAGLPQAEEGISSHLKVNVLGAFVDFHELAHTTAGGKINKLPFRHRGSPRLLHHRCQHSQGDTPWFINCHECAIDFQLSVSYAGRTYTATRSLQQIVQLRKDLVEEQKDHQWWSERGRNKYLGHNSSSNSTGYNSYCMSDDEATSSSINDTTMDSSDVSTTSISVGGWSFDEETKSGGIVFPELPTMSEEREERLWGFSGCGLAKLTALLHSYRPDLEEWFQAVTNTVKEDSAVLLDFLWEPLSTKSNDELHKGFSKLLSIKESFGEI